MAEPAADVPRIYVDADVYLDLITRAPTSHPDTGRPRWEVAQALFRAIDDGRVRLAASALIEAEIACAGAVRNDTQDVLEKVRGWFTAPATIWTDVDRLLARDAAAITRQWHQHRDNKKKKLGGADATHLAAAVRLHCDYLMTHDGGYPIGHDVSGVRVRRPELVWQPTLLDADVD